MVPDGVSEQVRASLLEADVMVKPLLWLASTASDGIAIEDAGWAAT